MDARQTINNVKYDIQLVLRRFAACCPYVLILNEEHSLK